MPYDGMDPVRARLLALMAIRNGQRTSRVWCRLCPPARTAAAPSA
jgi:hypothetical protein